MSVYVDRIANHIDTGAWCHMLADTHDELMEMAQKIGLKGEWIQKPGTQYEHFDLRMSMRAKAIRNGAKEVGPRDLARVIKAKEGATA